MLAVSAITLIGLAFFLLRFAHYVSRYRQESFWASEVGVLVILTPGAMVLFVAGGICLIKFWLGGGHWVT